MQVRNSRFVYSPISDEYEWDLINLNFLIGNCLRWMFLRVVFFYGTENASGTSEDLEVMPDLVVGTPKEMFLKVASSVVCATHCALYASFLYIDEAGLFTYIRDFRHIDVVVWACYFALVVWLVRSLRWLLQVLKQLMLLLFGSALSFV